jgi:outer membrane protein insertion porin family
VNGFSLRTGYDFSDHLRQAWTYSLIDRNVYSVASTASIYIQELAGTSDLSQIGQTLTIDYRDSKVDPHAGWVLRGGTDFAGAGGTERFVRTKIDAATYIPLDTITGNADWDVAITAGTGYLFNTGVEEKIIDRFFLGGDNLRGFETGGAGPHSVQDGDSIGGRFIWTSMSARCPARTCSRPSSCRQARRMQSSMTRRRASAPASDFPGRPRSA